MNTGKLYNAGMWVLTTEVKTLDAKKARYVSTRLFLRTLATSNNLVICMRENTLRQISEGNRNGDGCERALQDICSICTRPIEQ